MSYPRCPQLESLTNRLVETYRTLSLGDLLPGGGTLAFADSPVTELHSAIRDHKEHCLLCQKIASVSKMVLSSGRAA
jgi:hypothetical protein